MAGRLRARRRNAEWAWRRVPPGSVSARRRVQHALGIIISMSLGPPSEKRKLCTGIYRLFGDLNHKRLEDCERRGWLGRHAQVLHRVIRAPCTSFFRNALLLVVVLFTLAADHDDGKQGAWCINRRALSTGCVEIRGQRSPACRVLQTVDEHNSLGTTEVPGVNTRPGKALRRHIPQFKNNWRVTFELHELRANSGSARRLVVAGRQRAHEPPEQRRFAHRGRPEQHDLDLVQGRRGCARGRVP